MSAWIQFIHFAAGVVVLAEALNKLERATPCRRGLSRVDRITEWLKAIAWLCLALGGASAVVSPFMPFLPIEQIGALWPLLMPTRHPTLQDTCIVLGCALLIIRTRVKEG